MELGPEAEHQKAVQGVQKVLFVRKATGCCAGQYCIYYIVGTEFIKLAQASFFAFPDFPHLDTVSTLCFLEERQPL